MGDDVKANHDENVAQRATKEPIVVRAHQRVRDGKRQHVRKHVRRPIAQLNLRFEFSGEVASE
jgi:hypothetical protein